MNSIQMERPIRFIQSTENDFKINDEAMEFFSSCEKPVVVLAVAGRYREGKSYLANYLLGEQKGFALGSTLESETKGKYRFPCFYIVTWSVCQGI